ncbi:acyl carrier protein [Kutzneria buriramensis]|uniref:Minimal PKS acyl carrier protein n=1 Tax=Kutzneria buriramensis TaxID=1045776 RepID=A0A3E0H554_9PSEU|nr:acyl carrier protein [Kutzneria buriramensis]REH38043.1 minimal PKS acyl carrier protein [Kutzneria buriramensis]
MSSIPELTYQELASIILKHVGVTVNVHRLSHRLTTFADIGVDSVGMLAVVRELEHRRRVDLGGTAAQDCPTPRQLLTRLREAQNGAV